MAAKFLDNMAAKSDTYPAIAAALPKNTIG